MKVFLLNLFKHPLFVWLMLFAISSNVGCKRCHDELCTLNEEVSLYFVGYSQHEVDTLICYRYQQDATYAVLIDSVLLFPTYVSADTTSFLFTQSGQLANSFPNEAYDLEMVVESDTKRIRINGIRRNMLSREVCRGGLFSGSKAEIACINPLIEFSYSVNSGSVIPDGNALFIVK